MRFLTPFVVLVFLFFITGCTGSVQQNVQQNARVKPQRAKIGVCMDAIRSADWIALQVPSSQISMSNTMAAATVRLWGSDTLDALLIFLSQPTRPALALVGESDELTAATLLAALSKLDSVPTHSRDPICLIGDAGPAEQIKAVAQRVGISLVVVPRP